ncbi:type II toxin-antitoxin system VapC family toxin [Nesterenkonia sp. MY13]|uniref:Ribonuclease VapC n=1 Tax=Nesterenkonia sedimenti TaxID=1463632 RepID=A0A7X8THT7_9MICC|nr:type II toxin-antitoxin system VapC family toxin [Nesterenkonia sedimenti]NLS08839.1 type II toxin-antitoxin system VapC family toxin [Nesterenkonia sedimenti]
MRDEEGILDTSVVIDLAETQPEDLPKQPAITAITLAELSVGPLAAHNETDRATRQTHLQQAEADFDPLPFDAASARAFGAVASQLRQAGRKRAARAYDALIAATAISQSLPVYTKNPDDFEGIEGLVVRAVD